MKDDASLANRLSIVALTPIAAGIMVLAGALSIVVALYGRGHPRATPSSWAARWPRSRSAWSRSR